MGKFPMTPEGLKKLEAELKKIYEVDRPANVRAIQEAREQGDLSENAGYKCAKEEQSMIAGRIAYLEGRAANAQVIDPAKLSGDHVVFGAKVSLEDLDTGGRVVYRLVGEDEADIKQGSISITSPIARGLIRRQVGEQVNIVTPSGTRKILILSVEF
jgi:transcription elongation factor GreA